eukprot:TRINITY_DN16407_c0_g1_i2.p2 TRINITY_DN16407_c0_g1~~TRINITY_DN16407_c0_g1_i2.p2  ORF type:complete len:142 (-),score=13.10 TRINITY_DN16407_c0_g1_i2:127-552(-)
MSTKEEMYPQLFDGKYSGEVQLEYMPCINYAMMHNHIAILKFCTVKNKDDHDWNMVRIFIHGEYINPAESIIETIQAGQTLKINTLKIIVDANQLIELTEGIDSSFKLSLSIQNEIIFEHEYPFYLMAFDQWPMYLSLIHI